MWAGDELVTIDEVAHLHRLSARTLRYRVAKAGLRKHGQQGRPLYRREDLDALALRSGNRARPALFTAA